jgi:hypothetical protein
MAGAASFEPPVLVAGRCAFPAPVQWFSVQDLAKRTVVYRCSAKSELVVLASFTKLPTARLVDQGAHLVLPCTAQPIAANPPCTNKGGKGLLVLTRGRYALPVKNKDVQFFYSGLKGDEKVAFFWEDPLLPTARRTNPSSTRCPAHSRVKGGTTAAYYRTSDARSSLSSSSVRSWSLVNTANENEN